MKSSASVFSATSWVENSLKLGRQLPLRKFVSRTRRTSRARSSCPERRSWHPEDDEQQKHKHNKNSRPEGAAPAASNPKRTLEIRRSARACPMFAGHANFGVSNSFASISLALPPSNERIIRHLSALQPLRLRLAPLYPRPPARLLSRGTSESPTRHRRFGKRFLLQMEEEWRRQLAMLPLAVGRRVHGQVLAAAGLRRGLMAQQRSA